MMLLWVALALAGATRGTLEGEVLLLPADAGVELVGMWSVEEGVVVGTRRRGETVHHLVTPRVVRPTQAPSPPEQPVGSYPCRLRARAGDAALLDCADGPSLGWHGDASRWRVSAGGAELVPAPFFDGWLLLLGDELRAWRRDLRSPLRFREQRLPGGGLVVAASSWEAGAADVVLSLDMPDALADPQLALGNGMVVLAGVAGGELASGRLMVVRFDARRALTR